MAHLITKGAIQRMYHDDNTPGSVVQVLDIKKLASSNSSQAERYRLVVSDSAHYQQSMVATQLNSMIINEEVKKNGLIKLTEVICNVVQNRRIIIVLGLEVVSEPVEKIGDPVNIDTAAASQSAFAGNQSSAAAPAPAPESKPVVKQQSFQKSTPAVVQNDAGNVVPINCLNPYQNKWRIKAQVSQKSQVRTWSNARGEGKLFSMTLMDDQGGEIRATMFKDGVDKYYDMLEDGKTYYIARGNLKPANQQYNTCKNDYEMSLGGESEIQYCSESIKVKMNYTFVAIKELENAQVQSNVDVIAVVKSVGEVSSIATKRGDNVDKRNITLIDDSEAAIDVTLWGDKAAKWEASEGSVVAMKALKVGDFNGRSLSASYGTLTELNPDIPRAAQVMAWYNQTGGQAVESLTKAGGGSGGPAPRKSIKQIKEEGLGMGEKPDWVEVKAFVSFIKHDTNYFYVACPETNKKCTEQGEGSWICEANNKVYTDSQIVRRYIMSVTTNDDTGCQWLTAFNEAGESLLGASANDMYQKQVSKDPGFEGAFSDACFKEYIFKLRCKQETYNDESRLKCMIQGVSPLNFVQESTSLLGSINEMLGRA